MGATLLGTQGLGSARIALAGKSGAGKTTVARHLAALLGLPQYSFATPLKEACRLWGFREPYPRGVLQRVGTVLRDHDAEIFIKLLESRWPEDGGAVIDDLRFRNELAWCRDKGFTIVYLTGSHQPLPEEFASHQSETELTAEDADLVLDPAPVATLVARVLEVVWDARRPASRVTAA